MPETVVASRGGPAQEGTPVTVLQLLGPSTGGIRRHVGALSAALEVDGWIVVTAGPAGVLDGIRPIDVEVPIPTSLQPLGLLRAARRLRRALVGGPSASGGAGGLRPPIDIVHAHGLKAGWLAVVSGRLVRRRAPVVVTVHNLILDETSGRAARFMRVLERAVFRRADALVAVSPEVGGYVQQHTDRVVRVIRPVGPAPRAVRPPDEVRERLGVRPGQPLVVCVARLHPQKGLPTLIEATERLVAGGTDLRVAIIGEGPLAAELTALIHAKGLDTVVTLAGPSDNAPDELAVADVVAIPSVWESGPLVLAEALELGRPVVATPVGLVPEIVREGESGRIVPVGDARALARAIAGLLADPAGAEAMAANGRRALEQVWGADALVAATEALYRELLTGR